LILFDANAGGSYQAFTVRPFAFIMESTGLAGK